MRKRVLAGLLTVALALSLLPVSALASTTTFSSGQTCTRAQIVTILYRLEGEPSPTGACPFQDVASGKYYEKAITWAAENGIVSGFSADTFGPDQNITREQMAAILYRYATYKKYDVSTAGDLSKFPDADKVSSYAVDAMKWANAAGLINGSNDGKLYPAGNATRAQVAAI